jgi:hypothetical protein
MNNKMSSHPRQVGRVISRLRNKRQPRLLRIGHWLRLYTLGQLRRVCASSANAQLKMVQSHGIPCFARKVYILRL